MFWKLGLPSKNRLVDVHSVRNRWTKVTKSSNWMGTAEACSFLVNFKTSVTFSNGTTETIRECFWDREQAYYLYKEQFCVQHLSTINHCQLIHFFLFCVTLYLVESSPLVLFRIVLTTELFLFFFLLLKNIQPAVNLKLGGPNHR